MQHVYDELNKIESLSGKMVLHEKEEYISIDFHEYLHLEVGDDIVEVKPMKFVLPCEKYEQKATEYIQEFYDNASAINGVGGLFDTAIMAGKPITSSSKNASIPSSGNAITFRDVILLPNKAETGGVTAK